MFIHKADDAFNPEQYFDSVPLYQGLFFRRWQGRYGRNIVTLVADDSANKVQAFVQCIEYVLPVVGSVWVAASGPLGSFSSDTGEEAFYKELRSLCVEIAPKTVAVRVQKAPEYARVRMTRAEQVGGSFMQPFAERVVSLEGDIESIISGFSGGTRRLVRRYERGACEDVRFHVEKTDFKKYFDTVYDLLVRLARVKKFGLHPQAYYEALFEELQEHPESGVLILGYVAEEEKPVSFVLIVYAGSEAYHLFSATSEKGYADDVPTLAQYVTLKEVKAHGATRYNLGGTSSTSPTASGDLSIFKKKFGGEQVEHPPSMDMVISGWRYLLFRLLRLRWVLVVRRLVVKLYKDLQIELDSEE